MVFEKLRKLMADQFSVEEDAITMDTNFVEDLDADSIDLMELMMAVEETFDIGEVEENALESLKTVGDVVGYISDRL
ncbi:MAG: acyl carrier protein [Clostridia bacterium]|jgi:acyl carrier protein|nr:acyl carrier protein [Clostridia bacterium]MBQ7491441.1 acyl carrier protein [Clostridia bacterium]